MVAAVDMSGWTNLVMVVFMTIVAVVFALNNQEEVVIHIPGRWHLANVPVFVLAFVFLLLGFVFGAVSGWGRASAMRKRAEQLQRQNLALERELTNLRNQPLDNDLQP
ncbi:MAG: LapA family protein [Magnetococcales bacterium]|nr:LapA family protein [Magnetococcales bacterium]